MRVCHTIRPNHKCEQPTRAIFCSYNLYTLTDTESSVEYALNSCMFLCSAYSHRTGTWCDRLRMDDSEAWLWVLLEELCPPKTKTYLIVHDSSYFLTLFDVLNQAPLMGWTLGRVILNCPPCIVTMKKDGRSVTILDLANVWPQLSSNIKIGNGDVQSADETNGYEPLQEMSDMLKRVTEMRDRMVEWWRFLKIKDLGGFSPTIGSQSFRVWRHGFMRHQVVIDTHDEALELARSAVYGGRCECFHVGSFRGEFTQLDINACYAAIMAEHNMPTRIKFWTKHGSIEDLERWSYDYVCIGRVRIRTDTPCYPLRRDGQLVFPIGRFETVLAGTELRSALVSGHIERVSWLVVYESEPAFKEYMEALWIMYLLAKDHGDIGEADKWKLLRNAFFGKWAQKGGNWENIDRTSDLSMRSWTELDYETRETRHFRQFGGLLQEKSQEKESQESHPAIAATITAGGRQLLWHYIQMAGVENVFYVDTDSLLVNAMGLGRLSRFVDSRKMGWLKVEGTYTSIDIFNAKHYRLGTTEKLSGKPAGASNNGTGTLDFSIKPGLDEQIRCGSPLKAVGMKVSRRFKDEYKKGTIGTDGKVSPLEV